MIIKVECPHCGLVNDVNTKVRMTNPQHQIVTCDGGDGEKSCGKVFVVMPKFSVKVEVSELKKARG